MRKTGESLSKIVEHVNSIDTQINTISLGAVEQLTGIQEVNSAMSSMDRITQQNAAMVEENTAVTHQLSDEVKKTYTHDCWFRSKYFEKSDLGRLLYEPRYSS